MKIVDKYGKNTKSGAINIYDKKTIFRKISKRVEYNAYILVASDLQMLV